MTAAMPSFKDHFSTRSAAYADFRPVYPARLAQALADLCRGRALALDCGCGTGQLSVLLAEHFAQVVATDASAAQIAHAAPCAGVRYQVAGAEASPLADGSADLVTVAQAAHWLDLARFYAEVRRVCRPHGVLALITYGVLAVDEPGCDRLVQAFYHDTLAGYWPPERRHVEAGYRTLPFPFPELAFPALEMEAVWDFAALFGYFTTWSAFKALENAGQRAQIDAFHAALAAAWGDPATPRRIRWPLSVRAGDVNA